MLLHQHIPLHVSCNCKTNFQAIDWFILLSPQNVIGRSTLLRFAKLEFSVPWPMHVLKTKAIFSEPIFSSSCMRPGMFKCTCFWSKDLSWGRYVKRAWLIFCVNTRFWLYNLAEMEAVLIWRTCSFSQKSLTYIHISLKIILQRKVLRRIVHSVWRTEEKSSTLG